MSDSPAASAATALPQPRRKSRWRWLFWLAVAVVLLLGVVFLAGEIIFRTDLPRNLVITTFEKEFGLRMTAQRLTTGWMGHTTLYDVQLGLPLNDSSFVTVKKLEVVHSPLPVLLLTGSLKLQKITIDQPDLIVQQDSHGQWNLAQVAQLLARAAGSNSATKPANQSNGIPQLPELHVNDATIHVADDKKRTATIKDASLSGIPLGPLVWQYDASVPGQLSITGKVAPGGDWSHEVDLSITDIGAWVSPWIKQWPPSAHVQAHWFGQLNNDQVTGHLLIESLGGGPIAASGTVTIIAGDGQTAIWPDKLAVKNSVLPALNLSLEGGVISASSASLELRQLAVALGGGWANISGKLSIADAAAHLEANWTDIALPPATKQSGSISITLTPPLQSAYYTMQLKSTGTAKSGAWDADFTLDGSGSSLKTVNVSMTANKLTLKKSGGESINLAGLTAQVASQGNRVVVQNFHIGSENPVVGQGWYSIPDKTAWLYITAHHWPIPMPGDRTLDMDLNAWYRQGYAVNLTQAYFDTSGLTFCAVGKYIFNDPKPVSAVVEINESDTNQEPDNIIRGKLHGKADLSGTLNPMNLALDGSAFGRDLIVLNRPLGKLNVDVTGSINGKRISLTSKYVDLLGGQWRFSGHWPAGNAIVQLDSLSVRRLSIPLALNTTNVTGTLDGQWQVTLKSLKPSGLYLTGAASIANFSLGKPTPVLAIEQIDVKSMKVDTGQITIGPVIAHHSDNGVNGIASLNLQTQLADPTVIDVKQIDVQNWPASRPSLPIFVVASAKGDVTVDLKPKSAQGNLYLGADVSLNKRPLGQAQLAVNLDGRAFEITNLHASALGGSATGNAIIDLNHLLGAHIALNWQKIDLSQAAGINARFKNISGIVDGKFLIEPATESRPLGPVSVSFVNHCRGGSYGDIPFGDMQLFGYFNTHHQANNPRDADWDRVRFVLDNSPQRPSFILAAGGEVDLWGRFTQHQDGVTQSLVNLTLTHLNLDTIMPPGNKIAKTPGVIDGNITIFGRYDQPNLATGYGQIFLNHSDLAGVGPIAFLYNAIHLSSNPNKPTGSGTIDFTLQNNTVYAVLRYFDRGSEIRVIGPIYDISAAPHCPVDLTAVASAEPLRSLDIPGVSDISAALSTIQHDAVSVRITGYLNKLKTNPILFGDLGAQMQELLFGDSKAAE